MRHENMRSTKSGEDGISDAIRKKERGVPRGIQGRRFI